MNNIVEEINDKHMEPWADACQRDNIMNTPLNPFIDQVTKSNFLFNRLQNIYLFINTLVSIYVLKCSNISQCLAQVYYLS